MTYRYNFVKMRKNIKHTKKILILEFQMLKNKFYFIVFLNKCANFNEFSKMKFNGREMNTSQSRTIGK